VRHRTGRLRDLRDLPTAQAAFAEYEWLRRPPAELISGAAAKTNQAKAGKAAPGSGMPSLEQMFAPVPDRLGRAGRGVARRSHHARHVTGPAPATAW
jgi:hypothetical protein